MQVDGFSGKVRVPAGVRDDANATVRLAQALHRWLGRSAPLVKRFKQVARCRAHFAALWDGAEVIGTESQARRSLEMLVHTAARSCRSRATARRAIDAQEKI
jgi:hypothetical protein